MDEYKWYFLYKGISQVFFKERTRDIFSRHKENHLEGRPLLYFVRTEKIIPVRVATLKDIAINIRGPKVPDHRDQLS